MFYKIYGVSVGSRKVIFFLSSQLLDILIKDQALVHFSFLVTHSIWRYSCLDDSDASNLFCMSHPELPGLLWLWVTPIKILYLPLGLVILKEMKSA